MKNESDMQSLEMYFRLMNLNGAAHVYRNAVEASILDALLDAPAAPEIVAGKCGTGEKPTRLLMEALCSLGVLAREGTDYALSPLARLLIGGEYRTLGDPYWQHLPTFLKTGVPIKKMDDPSQSERHYQAQAAALAWMLRPSAQAAAAMLEFGAKRRGLHVLDVGAATKQ